jgi:hypothetical protein
MEKSQPTGAKIIAQKNDNLPITVGAAAGCDLLIFKSTIKRSQPAAAPTQSNLHDP